MKDVQEQLKLLESEEIRSKLSQDEIDRLSIDLNPTRWAEQYLHDPENPKESLKVRWYQDQMLQCQQKKKVYRCGRQIGKTICLCIEMLWFSFTNGYKKILLVCPYNAQVDVVWTQIKRLIANSPVLKNSIVRIRDNPHTIEFFNGSIIRGFTAGSKTGNKATPVRGQSAHLIILDEADYLGDEAINAVSATLTSDPNTRIIGSSTPSGKREHFYHWCTDKKLGWTEFHFSSSVGPHWISIDQCQEKGIPEEKSLEYYYRKTCSRSEYEHEYEAEFGDESIGVFSGVHLDACLADYRYEDWKSYKYAKDGETVINTIDRKGSLRYYNPLNVYIMGVDWNRPENGVHLVILEYIVDPPNDVPQEPWWENCRNKWRVFWREEIHVKEMTQTFAVDRIVNLNKLLNLSYIYVDEGYGDVQIEMLHKIAMETSDTKTHDLINRVKPINSSTVIEIYDPLNSKKVKKPVKPFIINNAVRCIENHEIILPIFEDNQHSLVGQLRDFRVKKRNAEGRPIYEGEDHIIDAFCLALYGYAAEFTELAKRTHATSIRTLDALVQKHLNRSDVESRWSTNTFEMPQHVSDIPVGALGPAPKPLLERFVSKHMPGTEYTYTTNSEELDLEEREKLKLAEQAGIIHRNSPRLRTRGLMKKLMRRSNLSRKGTPGRRSSF